MLENYHVILASGSPRRKELLTQLEIQFDVKTVKGIDESFPSTLKGAEIPLYIAHKKSEAYKAELQKKDLIICADTIVWTGEQQMGKPANEEEAQKMLEALSGKTHEVITGVNLLTSKNQDSFYAQTKVTFAPLSKEEIDHYVKKYHPTDKAGAYGIQEWIGMIGIERIEGSYYNVMGMPLHLLYKHLQKIEKEENR